MIDNSLVANIYENEQPNAEIEEDEVEIEVQNFVSLGLGGGEDGFSPIVSLSKTGNVTTLEITDKNGKQTAKIYDGYNGHNGADGYTPVKGVDYFDGKDGKDGKDGYTPVKGVDYFDGKNGTSATHRWSGTTLYITSESGTSYANLKGDKGDNGTNGKDGKDGADGHTPIKGADYFTEADKAEMVASVIYALPKYTGEVESV